MSFLDNIFEKASAGLRHIVLPEGEDVRTIAAGVHAAQNKIAKITIIGPKDDIAGRINDLGGGGLDIDIIEPAKAAEFGEYADKLYQLRKHKGLSEQQAGEVMKDPMFFGTMMVKAGAADGMVAGAAHSSADTIRPALQIIKAAEGVSTVSSMFFICKGTTTYLYSDCGLNQDPNAEQLADITLSTAKTAQQFGFTPHIAMLSYSTKGSAGGAGAEKMILATEIAKAKLDGQFTGEYAIDGEIQFDAAFVPEITDKKSPNSPIRGRTNVFIFPDLGAGNIAYKITERLAGFDAFGPILQGLAKPVNDLSRGCSAEDIVATIAITAIQAQ